MKIVQCVKFLKMLKSRIGSDLVYNLYIDTDDEIYITVSDHKSTRRKFSNNTKLHRIHITKHDMNKQNFILCNEINTIFKDLFTENDDEIISGVDVDREE